MLIFKNASNPICQNAPMNIISNDLLNSFQKFCNSFDQTAEDHFKIYADKTNKELLFIEIELPGVKKENLSVKTENQILIIYAERKDEPNKWKYNKKIRLPKSIDMATVDAKLQDGILRIQFKIKQIDPKTHRTIEIK